MNRRIAKKMMEKSKRNYSPVQKLKAWRRLGSSYQVGVDLATGKDETVSMSMGYDVAGTQTGRSTTSFHNRTGQAPTSLPFVLPPFPPGNPPMTGYQFPVGNTGFVATRISPMTTDELNALTIPELKEIAKKKGITGYSAKPKPELVALIIANWGVEDGVQNSQ